MHANYRSSDPKSHFALKPDVELWRYMDFIKFVSMLDKQALFFARSDKLPDEFEGSYPKRNVQTSSKISSEISKVLNQAKNRRRFTTLNCWHEGPYESEAMWKLYSDEKNGIAIRTNVKDLADSFSCTDGRGVNGRPITMEIRKVRYIDFQKDSAPRLDKSDSPYAAFLYKRSHFEYEKEVRAIVQDLPIGDYASSADICEVGIYYTTDLSRLIHKVVVAPRAEDWFLELVKSLVHKYGLRIPVTRSEMVAGPTWKL